MFWNEITFSVGKADDEITFRFLRHKILSYLTLISLHQQQNCLTVSLTARLTSLIFQQ